jgi:oligopeptide transport system substrate-binding protein
VAQNFVLGHVLEGLARYGKNGDFVPGIAESWKLAGSGVTFKLRKDARWSDGKPVTAEDFVYAWKRVVDPATASPYAFILYPVKNAEAISQGKKPVSELGVSAPDARTVKVTFERPCPYFIGLTAYPTYAPARQDFVEKNPGKYGADAENILSNGPYKLAEWVHGASLKLEKNPSYWNARQIRIERIEVPFITPDSAARFNLFRDGKIDIVTLTGPSELARAQSDRMKIQSFTPGELTFLRFNFRADRPTSNANLRKAILAVADPKELVTSVIGIPGTKPGRGIIPESLKGVSQGFRKEHPLPELKPDLAQARKYLERAKSELGGTIRPLTLLTTDTVRQGREAEYFQGRLKKYLGLDVRIEKQILKVALAKQFAGEFDLASSSWFGDYLDPMAYAEIFASWNKNNRGKYESPEYDALLKEAQDTADQRKRMDALAKAERIAMQDAALVPKSESVEAYTQNPKLKGVIRRGMGPDPDFSYAELASGSH